MAQDSVGFMWFASRNGLYRYDGYELHPYWHSPLDTGSISLNFITSLHVGRDGVLWVATWGGGLNAFDYQTETFSHFRHDPSDENSLSSDFINDVTEDTARQIWIGADNGLSRLDRRTGKVTRFLPDPADPGAISDDRINVLYADQKGDLWIGMLYGNQGKGGLNRYRPSTGTFTHYYRQNDNDQSLLANDIWSILEDSRGNFWVGTAGDDLHLMDRDKGTFMRHTYDPARPERPAKPYAGPDNFNDAVFILFEDRDQRLWIGSPRGGLNSYDPLAQTYRRFNLNPNDPGGLKSWPAKVMCQSQDGTLWLGVNGSPYPRTQQIILNDNHFSYYPIGNWVNAILTDRQGRYWIGTGGSGLVRMDRSTGETIHFRHDPLDNASLGSNAIATLYEDLEGFLWVGFTEYGKGVNRLDPASGQIKRYALYPDTFPPFKDMIISMGEDPQGRLWFPTHGNGLYYYDRSTDVIRLYQTFLVGPDSLPLLHFNHFFVDSQDRIWLGCGGGMQVIGKEDVPLSINLLDPEKGELTHFPLDLPVSESVHIVIQIEEDRKGNLWLLTSQSLIEFDPSTGAFKQFHHRSNNFHQTSMRAMTKDDQGNLWIAGSEGFTFLDPERGSMHTYGPDQFRQTISCTGGSFNNRKGELFFGDANGFHAFFPEEVGRSSGAFKPKAILTEFRLKDAVLKPDPTGPLKTSIWGAKEIQLAHDENIFTIRFSGLYFRDPQATRYRFQLENYDEDWRWAGKDPWITYTKVPPGEYVFRLEAIGESGISSDREAVLRIIIHWPWWATWPAYLSYAAAALAITFFLFRMELRRRLVRAEAVSLRRLDHAKTALYTNVSHEFRTPITVIGGMANKVLEDPERWFRQGLDMIRRNAQRLLVLVDQLLDISKLEAGALNVQKKQGDVVAFLRMLIEPFEVYAQSKGQQLHFLSEEKKIWMDFDAEMLVKICSNLLSNAIKFTPSGGNFYVQVRERPGSAHLEIKVQDTGKGIPPQDLPHIFDRFYQSAAPAKGAVQNSGGTGIGLALTKELVHLLGGEINVQSRKGKGAEFTVLLPIRREAPLAAEDKRSAVHEMSAGFIGLSLSEPIDVEETSEQRPIALIVEDNPEVILYLQACLAGRYQIKSAENGAEGIRRAIEGIPDIIVSDIMMPETDGFELCETLKQDLRTSHIPIILLTAKADQASRISGLKLGADAYLAKPFHEEELLVRMEQLLEGRRRLRQYYLSSAGIASSAPVEPPTSGVPDREDAFVKEVRNMIEAEIDNFDLKVQDLCDQLLMSHSQLHRKLSAVIGLSPNRFIRRIRLERACEFLVNTERSVTAIAFDTGFSDSDYFSRVFHKEFGLSPTNYRERKNARI